MNEFNPLYPPTSNSLNRLKLEAALLPDAIRGKTGYELISTDALNTLINPYTSDIATFYEQVTLETEWAVDIVHTLGRHLGYLLLTLVGNDKHTHLANPDKSSDFWSYWSTVKTVYLGGGFISGLAGQILSSEAQNTLETYLKNGDYRVIQADYPQYLPLLGAARTVPDGNRALVLDFGGTFVKRAIAYYGADGLEKLQTIHTLRSGFPDNPDDPQDVFYRMVDMIVQSYGEVDAKIIPISIAAYVDEYGQPLPTQGGVYKHLAQLAGNLPLALSEAVSVRLQKPVQIKIFHDGTAAALRYTPSDHAAVIMIGTALGSGYPVERPTLRLRPIKPILTVTTS